MATIPAAHARLIAEAIELDSFFSDEEEIELLEMHDPVMLDAYKSLRDAANEDD